MRAAGEEGRSVTAARSTGTASRARRGRAAGARGGAAGRRGARGTSPALRSRTARLRASASRERACVRARARVTTSPVSRNQAETSCRARALTAGVGVIFATPWAWKVRRGKGGRRPAHARVSAACRAPRLRPAALVSARGDGMSLYHLRMSH